jgi:DNA helicase-2/ATP-dependent DNA helicase PcrA
MTVLEQIMGHVHEGHHFLLSGGAGSGKTFTLVEVLREITKENPTKKVACITYTNAAVKEIERRVNNDNLRVSTIHDFLWDCISHFQTALIPALIQLINDGVITRSVNMEIPLAEDYYKTVDNFKGIHYKEYCRVAEGVISHDEVLVLAEYMFRTYPKLCEILKGTYPFILVDEYQDTSPLVVKILLENLFAREGHHCIVGFFGDAMQSIYDDGIGNLDEYKHPEGNVYEVKKEQNRRNTQKVIELANKIRFDGLVQRPSDDATAPNMRDGQPKEGVIKFIYSANEGESIDKVRNYLESEYGWDFSDSQRTKELNLTHNLIAGKAGFPNLMELHNGDGILGYRDKLKKALEGVDIDTEGKTFGEIIEVLNAAYRDAAPREKKKVEPTPKQDEFIRNHFEDFEYAKSLLYDVFIKEYADKDQLVDDKKQSEDEESKTGSRRSEIVKHLTNIEHCIQLYKSKNITEFIAKTEYKINSVRDKKGLADVMQTLAEPENKTIGEIIEYAEGNGIVVKSDGLSRYEERQKYVCHRFKQIKYSEFHKLYEYLEGRTPFSTQHKTKGTEFDDVFVILDNGRWNNYNFEKLFTVEDAGQDKVTERTKKTFYVCCTRAMEQLAVYYDHPSEDVIAKAREWFGDDNMINISVIR